jgi:hypothetical protein
MIVNNQSNDIAVTISRPENTTAYTAGDVIGVAAAVAANAGSAILEFGGVPAYAMIDEVTLQIRLTAVISGMTTFRLHLYSSSPTAILDNAAWDLPAGDRAAYQGFVDIPTIADLGSTLWSQTTSVNKRIKTTSGVVYGLLQTIGAYTPSSADVHVVTIKVTEV